VRVQIDVTSLLLEGAGVKNYIHYWLRHLELAAMRRADQIATYPPGLDAAEELNHTSSADSAINRLRLYLVYFVNLPFNPTIDFFHLGADVFHCSQHCANPPKRKKFTATLFDMSCWTTPQYHTQQNVAATRRYAERILKRCDGIIAISHHARCEAIQILGIPEERIHVVYPGVASAFFEATALDADRVRNKYQLYLPYALFVGCIEPRKNIGGLLRAWQELPESFRRDNHLVIAGPFGWESGEMRAVLASADRSIRYIGYVAEADLPGLFAGAEAFICPSFYEGFGLPVAQAMAAGLPVITSNRSCLPEVVADAGICVDPDSANDLAAAIWEVLTRPALASELAARSRLRAHRFQWTSSAVESLDFFHSVAGK
jgi:glycosyltransferase involved in cell wall biosynthesis